MEIDPNLPPLKIEGKSLTKLYELAKTGGTKSTKLITKLLTSTDFWKPTQLQENDIQNCAAALLSPGEFMVKGWSTVSCGPTGNFQELILLAGSKKLYICDFNRKKSTVKTFTAIDYFDIEYIVVGRLQVEGLSSSYFNKKKAIEGEYSAIQIYITKYKVDAGLLEPCRLFSGNLNTTTNRTIDYRFSYEIALTLGSFGIKVISLPVSPKVLSAKVFE